MKNIISFFILLNVITISLGQWTKEQKEVLHDIKHSILEEDTICVLNKTQGEIISFIKKNKQELVFDREKFIVYYQHKRRIEILDSVNYVSKKGSYYYCETTNDKRFLLNKRLFLQVEDVFYSLGDDWIFVQMKGASLCNILYKNKLSSNTIGRPYRADNTNSHFTVVILKSRKTSTGYPIRTNAVVDYDGKIMSARDSIRKFYGFTYRDRAVVVKGLNYFYIDKNFTTRSESYDYIYPYSNEKYTIARSDNKYFIIRNYDGDKKEELQKIKKLIRVSDKQAVYLSINNELIFHSLSNYKHKHIVLKNIKEVIGMRNKWLVCLSNDNKVIFQSYLNQEKSVVFEKTNTLYQALRDQFYFIDDVWW